MPIEALDEDDDGAKDFRAVLRVPTPIPTSKRKEYLSRTSSAPSLRVQQLLGPSILHVYSQESINLELMVRNKEWTHMYDTKPFQSEVEALTLARCLHLHFCTFEIMGDALLASPWSSRRWKYTRTRAFGSQLWISSSTASYPVRLGPSMPSGAFPQREKCAANIGSNPTNTKRNSIPYR